MQRRELLEMDRVSMVIKKHKLSWFELVECSDDGDWVMQCMSIRTEGT